MTAIRPDQPRPRLAPLRTAAVAGAVAVLALAGCAARPSAAPAGTPGAAQHIELTFAGGAVRGGVTRIPVRLGSTVDLDVHSDVTDEVHLHGYNRMSDVKAGASTTLEFVANTPGVFEVELEQHGSPLTQLQVS
jgi:hypothetical protein